MKQKFKDTALKIKEAAVKRPKLARIVLCAAILLFGIFSFIGLKALKGKPKKKAASELVKTLLVTEINPCDIRIKVSGYGTVKPLTVASISSQIKGQIVYEREPFKVGELVKKGELILKIDDSDYLVVLKEASAEMERLKNEKKVLEQTLRNEKEELKTVEEIYGLEQEEYKRAKLLYDKKVTNAAQLNRSAQNLSIQKKALISIRSRISEEQIRISSIDAQIQKARAVEHMAKINIERSSIISPFDGRFENIFVDKDEYVNAGTKLFDLANDKELAIYIPIDAFDAAQALALKKSNNGYSNWFKPPENMKIEIEWTENPSMCSWEGKIARIKDYDSDSRTVTLEVRPVKPLCKEEGAFPLVSGMFCKVVFHGEILKDAIKIPWVSLQFDRDVYIVDKDSRLEERRIKIFATEGDEVLVSSGLKKGDLLVVQRLPRGLINGMKVKPVLKKEGTPSKNEKP